VDLGCFVRDFCRNLAVIYGASERGVTVTVSADHCELDLNRAIPVVLIINELVTNAFKHAFPHQMSGNIAITVGNRAGSVFVTVEDDGVGRPAGNAGRSSTGMDLICSLAKQAQAVYSQQVAGGLKFCMIVPRLSSNVDSLA
jgi:two-component sensor histidine kinase